jgi:hypothetical protein
MFIAELQGIKFALDDVSEAKTLRKRSIDERSVAIVTSIVWSRPVGIWSMSPRIPACYFGHGCWRGRPNDDCAIDVVDELTESAGQNEDGNSRVCYKA